LVIELIFYEGTLDVERYINEILGPFFVNLVPAEERFTAKLRKLSEHYTMFLGNLMGRIELLARVCGPLDPQI
jgi:hypothetical protein